MYNATTQNILILIIVCTTLILLLIFFIASIIYRYQQKQNEYFKIIEEIKITHSNALLQSQVEMQEQTFQNISREIHDNIGQKLAFAKLQLNTLPYNTIEKTTEQVNESVQTLSEVINDLSDISRSMSSEIILQNGIIKAIELELVQIKKSDLYDINLEVTGNTVFLDSDKELVLFRVTQEALHNILKHSRASKININMNYKSAHLHIGISDNGKGFNIHEKNYQGTGIKNMKKRIQLLNGTWKLNSGLDNGTQIKIEIPFI